MWIEGGFDGTMHLEHGRGELAREPVAFEETYAMLPSHRASKIKCSAQDLFERDLGTVLSRSVARFGYEQRM